MGLTAQVVVKECKFYEDSGSDKCIDKAMHCSCPQDGLCEDKNDLYQAGSALLLSHKSTPLHHCCLSSMFRVVV